LGGRYGLALVGRHNELAVLGGIAVGHEDSHAGSTTEDPVLC